MAPKIFSLRPPAVSKDVTLETLFRVEMKRDDMEAIKPGDPIMITSAQGKGGVGIASLSSDTSKSSGSNSFVKISPELREFLGLDLSDKCSISKHEGQLRGVKNVTVSEKGPIIGVDDLSPELIEFWVTLGLAQLQAIIPGHSFSITPVIHGIKHRKRVYNINNVESEYLPGDGENIVPFSFIGGISKVTIRQPKAQANGAKTPDEGSAVIKPSFVNLPGIEQQLKQLEECLERVNWALQQRSSIIEGCVPILLHGPSGTGKTSILNQLAEAPGWKKVYQIKSSDLGGAASKVEGTISKVFSEASANQPSLVIIDRLEKIAGRENDSPITSDSLTDNIEKCAGTRIQVVAAATRPLDLDQTLLSCFYELIELPTPDTPARVKMLQHFAKKGVDLSILERVAEKTHAFNARDLKRLCSKADVIATPGIVRWVDGNAIFGKKEDHLAIEGDFDKALPHVHPSLMNEIYVEVPKVNWSDIAGSEDIKRKLRDDVELPLKYPGILADLGLKLKLGTLLYGPPGCSKTLIAKALATETGLNFISVKGPELISKYVGESERNIREAFRKARAAAPAIIFFDEFDSLAPIRGSGHEGVNTVPTLLTELDGVEDVKDVLVLAATNRPEAIDPALLRYGRLGTHLFVAPPTRNAILQILTMNTKDVSQADLDLVAIADQMSASQDHCFSGADVAAVCEAAKRLYAKSILTKATGTSDDVIGTQQSYLLQALKDYKPSLSNEQVERLRGWSLAGGMELVD